MWLAPNDKQQLEPMLGKIGALPEELGEPETLLADTGCFSAANVEACAASPGRARPRQAGLRANILFKFQAMVTRLHSPRTLSSPRSEN